MPGVANPGCGCSNDLVRELVDELQERKVRGDIRRGHRSRKGRENIPIGGTNHGRGENIPIGGTNHGRGENIPAPATTPPPLVGE